MMLTNEYPEGDEESTEVNGTLHKGGRGLLLEEASKAAAGP